MVAVRHVDDRGLLGERHQRGPDAARRGEGPRPLDLHLIQLEVRVNGQQQGLPLDAVMDQRWDVNELGADLCV